MWNLPNLPTVEYPDFSPNAAPPPLPYRFHSLPPSPLGRSQVVTPESMPEMEYFEPPYVPEYENFPFTSPEEEWSEYPPPLLNWMTRPASPKFSFMPSLEPEYPQSPSRIRTPSSPPPSPPRRMRTRYSRKLEEEEKRPRTRSRSMRSTPVYPQFYW